MYLRFRRMNSLSKYSTVSWRRNRRCNNGGKVVQADDNDEPWDDHPNILES